jgi:NAD dependent epimerase/dehydratase family enzyme
VPGERLADLAAEAMGVTAIGRRLPFALLRIFLGQVVSESMAYENRLSNNRLRSTGFEFTFPTCEQGIPEVVETWLKEKGA